MDNAKFEPAIHVSIRRRFSMLPTCPPVILFTIMKLYTPLAEHADDLERKSAAKMESIDGNIQINQKRLMFYFQRISHCGRASLKSHFHFLARLSFTRRFFLDCRNFVLCMPKSFVYI